MTQQRQNVAWISNLRLIAMVAVVVLHTASPLLFAYGKVPNQDWVVGDIYNALTRFAVPVFVMITGALTLGREYELFDFLRKRIGRLIPPFIFWSLVYIAYRRYNEEFFFTGNWWADTRFVLHQLKTGSYYHLWYVYELIGLYLLMPVLGKFVRQANNRELLYFLAIWFAAIICTAPYVKLFETAVDLHNFTGYAGYLVLGYYITKTEFRIKGLGWIAALTFMVMALVITYGTWFLQVNRHELSTYFYEPLGPFVVVLSAAASLAAKHFKIRLPHRFQNLLNSASKYTLGIYFCHALLLNVFELNDVTYASFNPLLSVPTIAIACFMVSWAFIWVLSKLPVIRYIGG